MPRTSTCLGSVPVTMKPPMPTSLPVRTFIRVDRFNAWTGPGVGEPVAVAVAVAVGVGPPGVDVAVAVAVAVAVEVTVAVAVDVTVAVGVTVSVGVADGVAQGAPEMKIVSMSQPVTLTLLSDAIRKRSLIVCPFRFGPRFATVLM